MLFFKLNPIAQYLLLLAIAIGGYGFYLKFAVPAIEGTGTLQRRINKTTASYRPPDLKHGFEDYFAPDDWELKPCKTVRTADGKILCQDWLPQEDGLIEIFPFTMVLESESDKPPTIIRCMQGAQIFLNGPLALSKTKSAEKSRIEKAKLMGQVLIYRPKISNPDDFLELQTSNIHIENGEVRTIEPVEFQFGQNYGRGSNLRIELTQKQQRAGRQDMGEIDGVRRIRLANLDFLKLKPKSKSTPQPLGVTSNSSVFGGSKLPIEVTCKGAFDFDLNQNEIEFNSQVLVQQIRTSGNHDTLSCEKLVLTLAGSPLADSIKSDQPRPSNDIAIKTMRAMGTPAVLNAHSQQTRIHGDELFFNQTEKLVFASTKRADQWVTIENPKFSLATRQLTYELTEDQSLGDLDAQGPGRFQKFAQKTKIGDSPKKEQPFVVQWNKQLTISEDQGKKRVTVDGQSKLTIRNDTFIDAQILKFWLTEVPFRKPQDPKTRWEYFPAKLIAMGQVNIDSPRVIGTSRQLTATWPEVTRSPKFNTSLIPGRLQNHTVHRPQQNFTPIEPKPFAKNSSTPLPTTSSPRQDTGFRPQDSLTQKQQEPTLRTGVDGISARERFANPTTSIPTTSTPLLSSPQQKSKIKFDGDYVNIRFSDHSSNPKVETLKIDGNVDVIETKPDDSVGIRAKGTHLHLSPQFSESTEPLYRIFVGGNSNLLAEIDYETLKIRGREIHIDQNLNKFWANGMGELVLRELTEQVEVQWFGGMVFDGTNIYFEEQVRLAAMEKLKKEAPNPESLTSEEAVFQLTRTESHILNLVLANPVKFSELNRTRSSSNPKMEVREIVLINQLPKSKRVFQQVKHNLNPNGNSQKLAKINLQYLDKDQKIVEQQQFVAPDARIAVAEGNVSAKGPGFVTSIRKANSKQKKSAPFSFSQRNDQKHSLSYLRVNFDSGIKANQQENSVDIVGNIRALFLGTEDWNLQTNPDEIDRVPAGGGKLLCDRIDIDQWQARGYETPMVEFVARGNAQIQGDLFRANSNRISYQDSTDLLIIEGTPRAPAQLWHQKTPRSPKTNLIASKIWYRPSDQWTQVNKIKSAGTSFDASEIKKNKPPSRNPNTRAPLSRIRNR